MSEPRTEAGRTLLGLDVTPESGYWVNLNANEMCKAILAIEDEAARPSDDLTAALQRVRSQLDWNSQMPPRPTQYRRGWADAHGLAMALIDVALAEQLKAKQ